MTLPIAIASLLAGLVLCGAVAVHWLTQRVRRLQRELEQAKAHMLRYAWLEWWTRNAAECPPVDPARPLLVALAYAASLAPDFAVFLRDLDELAGDEDPPTTSIGRVAKGFADELRMHTLPWVLWRETGKPPHNAEAQRRAYLEALANCIRLELPDRPGRELEH